MPVKNIDKLIETSLSRISEIEKKMWQNDYDDALLSQYHAEFQQLEQLKALQGDDRRHEFVIVIPVADRPQHLQSCVRSLLNLCKAFTYGGYSKNKYSKVSVIIADDSKEHFNIAKHKSIAAECNLQGLSTLYFGPDDQLDQVALLSKSSKNILSKIIGNYSSEAFYHKGPSITRNITYLELNKISCSTGNVLFYFVDSDQEFRIKISTSNGDKNIYGCNYLYYLDQIFTRTTAKILTGKVVGDPPVSPSVMAGNFLEDVISFLHRIAEFNPNLPCQFHQKRPQDSNEASYHDMAALFGFTPSLESFQYQCSIKGEHNNARCFTHFTSKLSRFFYGEHPTRKTYYRHEDILNSVQAARTVYTGNYIFKPELLKYFIPFAPLKLRMAGPVLGRIIKSELKEQFVSANLPLLHKRTVRDSGQSEFRPGIFSNTVHIDLSGEFERQFYGDVMLFSMEKFITQGYPQQTISESQVLHILDSTHIRLLQQYNGKRLEISSKLALLKSLNQDKTNWWANISNYAEGNEYLKLFISNIEYNFGENALGYKLINSAENKKIIFESMIESITSYAEASLAWQDELTKSCFQN